MLISNCVVFVILGNPWDGCKKRKKSPAYQQAFFLPTSDVEMRLTAPKQSLVFTDLRFKNP